MKNESSKIHSPVLTTKDNPIKKDKSCWTLDQI